MNRFVCWLLGAMFCAVSTASWAQTMRFIYPPPESATDARYLYYWQLLDAALAANRAQYGDYMLASYDTAMTFQRAVAEVESGQGRVNIVSRATNRDLESRMRAVPIPLDKGLLGTRMFLVTPETQKRLEQVHTLDQLKQFTIGQGSTWTDVKVLDAAGFKLVLADDYNGLFAMVAAGRFDLFSRGAVEIEAEWRARKEALPNLMIEKRLLLQYPMPRYFFVPRNAEGERMALRIEDGLKRLRASGEFERRYLAWKKLVLKDLDLAGRTVFRLPNPQLTEAAPLNDPYWWDDLGAELAPARR